MANISELSVLIKANTKQASQQMKGFGQSVGSTFAKMKVGILAVGTAITGFAIASVKEFIEVGDMLGKMSARTGIAVEQLDDLRIAFDLSGTSINGFERGMRTLIMRVDDANNGVTDYVTAFGRIGIAVKDLEGLKPDEVFMLVANGIAGLTTEMDKQQVAIDLLGGKFGTSLLPALQDGEQGFRDLLKEAGAMSNWTDEQSQMAEDLADDMTKLNSQLDILQKELAVHIVPLLIKTVTATNDYIDSVKNAENPTLAFGVSLGKLAGVITPAGITTKGIDFFTDKLKNKLFPTLETSTEKTQRLMDINVKLFEFFEFEQKELTKLQKEFANLTQNGLDLTNIAVEELTTNFAKVPKVFSDIDSAQDLLSEAMGGIANVVGEQEKAVKSATKSWIDYHMAIGMFQPIKDATGIPGSIESMMPSMMGAQGQQAYRMAIIEMIRNRPGFTGWITQEMIDQAMAGHGAFSGAGGGFQVTNTFTNKAELSAIEKENTQLGR